MSHGARKLTAKIRPPLMSGDERRLPPVDEQDPDRVRLVGVCLLRDADPEPLAIRIASAAPEGSSLHDPAAALAEARRRISADWDRACREFVKDNLGLAIAYARELAPRHVPESDLIHACVVGLLRAIREFDPRRAGKFSTFAVWKMRHEANTLIRRQNGAIVPPPGQLVDDRRALDEEVRRLSSLLGCLPDDAALLDALREREEREAEAAQAEENAAAAREARDPERVRRPRRWASATEDGVRRVREAHVGFGHRALDPRRPSAGPAPETVLHVRRAFAQLPPILRAVLAEDLDLDLPGADDVPVPECPVARRVALSLARDRLREILERR